MVWSIRTFLLVQKSQSSAMIFWETRLESTFFQRFQYLCNHFFRSCKGSYVELTLYEDARFGLLKRGRGCGKDSAMFNY